MMVVPCLQKENPQASSTVGFIKLRFLLHYTHITRLTRTLVPGQNAFRENCDSGTVLFNVSTNTYIS